MYKHPVNVPRNTYFFDPGTLDSIFIEHIGFFPSIFVSRYGLFVLKLKYHRIITVF